VNEYRKLLNEMDNIYKEVEMDEAKTAGKTGIDIGDGMAVAKVGYDANGNWSYWIRKDGGNKKIQTINLNGGSGKISDINDFRAKTSDAVHAIKMIKDYLGDSSSSEIEEGDLKDKLLPHRAIKKKEKSELSLKDRIKNTQKEPTDKSNSLQDRMDEVEINEETDSNKGRMISLIFDMKEAYATDDAELMQSAIESMEEIIDSM